MCQIFLRHREQLQKTLFVLAFEKLRITRPVLFGYVMRRNENHITRRILSIKVDGCRSRERPKKI